MRCEVCGREIRGQPYRRIIEGARMTVCAQCAPFGNAEWTPTSRGAPRRRQRPAPRSEVEAVERLELVEGYGEKIRRARQRMRMTVEDLGKSIRERESVIKKLEKEEFAPDRSLVRKLRNALKIDLLVAEESSSTPVIARPSQARTLGDLVKLNQGSEATEGEEEDVG